MSNFEKIKNFLRPIAAGCKNILLSEAFKEIWAPKIWRFATRVILLIISIAVGGYYLHNVYEFNADKHEAFKKISSDLSLLRNRINLLSAMMRDESQDTNKTSQTSKIKKTANGIIDEEISILNNAGDWSYYFGEGTAKKGAYFLAWANQITTLILKKQYTPPDRVTDTLYRAILYSIQNQLYSPHACTQCQKLTRIPFKELPTYITTLDQTYPKNKLSNLNSGINFKDIYSLRLQITKFKQTSIRSD